MSEHGGNPEWEAERMEAEQFLRERGIVSVQEIRSHLDSALTEEEKQKIAELREILEPVESVIKGFPEVQRLHGLNQLGGKVNANEHYFDPSKPFVFTPAFHSRYQHSELTAELAKIVSVKGGLSEAEASTLVAGGWLHDIGHSAFSHCGDELLMKHGRPDHEHRTLNAIKKNETSNSLKGVGVDVEMLEATILEKGKLGSVQKILDTLSYLSVDTLMFGEKTYADYGASLAADIRGLTDSAPVVQTPELWQRFVEDRARMFREVYYHPLNKMMDEARRRLIEIAVKKGFLTYDQLEHGTDGELNDILKELTQVGIAPQYFTKHFGDRNLNDYKDLYEVSLGLYDRSKWSEIRCGTEEEVVRFFSGKIKDPKVMEQSFVGPPFDYRKKKIRIQDLEGKVQDVVAKDCELREEDEKYIIYYPKA